MIGDRIKERREALGLSQEELAKRLGYKSRSSINKMELGIQDVPQRRMKDFARVLHCTTGFLLEDDLYADESSKDKKGKVPDLSSIKRIPLYGTIACGEPIMACQEYEYVEIDELSKADFCLRAQGDSMVECGIMNGSLVLCKDTQEVENGQIAAVLIDGDATLKKVYNYGDILILKPCNRDFLDLVYKEEELNHIRVIGRAIGCISAL